MIDWHNHLLPDMDDGSRSVAESVSMLQAQKAQGVTAVIATPHFYANDESVESFLRRRTQSLEKLRTQWRDDRLLIRLGAEVRYYLGISRLERLKDLCIEGSNLLLLEMPMSRWTESMLRELTELSGRDGICIVLAHIDRYLSLQKQEVWDRLLECGILMQTNASFFNSVTTRSRALAMLRDGYVHVLGSDCHNMTSRPPQLGKAFDRIQKRFGADYIQQMTEFGYSLFNLDNH
ncbi:MAG: hypothetical protein IIX28_04360 [Clostridia bacterium]|nr:hypothetical protein [Clostridia bacterium]